MQEGSPGTAPPRRAFQFRPRLAVGPAFRGERDIALLGPPALLLSGACARSPMRKIRSFRYVHPASTGAPAGPGFHRQVPRGVRNVATRRNRSTCGATVHTCARLHSDRSRETGAIRPELPRSVPTDGRRRSSDRRNQAFSRPRPAEFTGELPRLERILP